MDRTTLDELLQHLQQACAGIKNDVFNQLNQRILSFIASGELQDTVNGAVDQRFASIIDQLKSLATNESATPKGTGVIDKSKHVFTPSNEASTSTATQEFETLKGVSSKSQKKLSKARSHSLAAKSEIVESEKTLPISAVPSTSQTTYVPIVESSQQGDLVTSQTSSSSRKRKFALVGESRDEQNDPTAISSSGKATKSESEVEGDKNVESEDDKQPINDDASTTSQNQSGSRKSAPVDESSEQEDSTNNKTPARSRKRKSAPVDEEKNLTISSSRKVNKNELDVEGDKNDGSISTRGRKFITVHVSCPFSECSHIKFNNENAMESHLKNTHKMLPFRCLSKNCKESFADISALQTHVNEAHSKQKNWPCLECKNSKFNSFDALRSHEYNNHGGLFRCSQRTCNFSESKSRSEIEEHFEQVHKSSKTIISRKVSKQA